MPAGCHGRGFTAATFRCVQGSLPVPSENQGMPGHRSTYVRCGLADPVWKSDLAFASQQTNSILADRQQASQHHRSAVACE